MTRMREFTAKTTVASPSPQPSPRWGEGEYRWAPRGSVRGAGASSVPFSPRGEGARRADEGASPATGTRSPQPSPRSGEGRPRVGAAELFALRHGTKK